jgi:hypothetical protein
MTMLTFNETPIDVRNDTHGNYVLNVTTDDGRFHSERHGYLASLWRAIDSIDAPVVAYAAAA